jgi:hypothetical protein
MWNGRCPVCLGTEVYGHPYGVITNHGGALKVGPSRIFRAQVDVAALICATCGYVALQVAAPKLAVLREIFEADGWARIPLAEQASD